MRKSPGYPEECLDRELYDGYLAMGNYTFFRDQDMTDVMSFEEIQLGEHRKTMHLWRHIHTTTDRPLLTSNRSRLGSCRLSLLALRLHLGNADAPLQGWQAHAGEYLHAATHAALHRSVPSPVLLHAIMASLTRKTIDLAIIFHKLSSNWTVLTPGVQRCGTVIKPGGVLPFHDDESTGTAFNPSGFARPGRKGDGPYHSTRLDEGEFAHLKGSKEPTKEEQLAAEAKAPWKFRPLHGDKNGFSDGP